MDEQHEVIAGKPLSERDKSWSDYLTKTEQETPQRLEEVAKFLTGLVSVVFTIFVNMGDKFKELPVTTLIIMIAPWILSLVLSVITLFPFTYKLVNRNYEHITAYHQNMVKQKYTLLKAAAVLFLIALICTSYIYFTN